MSKISNKKRRIRQDQILDAATRCFVQFGAQRRILSARNSLVDDTLDNAAQCRPAQDSHFDGSPSGSSGSMPPEQRLEDALVAIYCSGVFM
jgi:hypothetical protein